MHSQAHTTGIPTKFTWRLTLGEHNGREVEFASGVVPGELVAMNVGDGIGEGDPVRPVRLSAGSPME